jgi:general secretion pathway protein J
MSRKRSGGLTLVEVLVALAILGLLSLLAYRALDSTLRARERTTMEAERWRELSFFFGRLQDDVGQIASRGPRLPSGERQPVWKGGESSLELATFAGGRQVLRQVHYRLQDGIVELRLWPVFDAAPGTAPEVHRIAHSIRSLRFSFLDASRRWVGEWPPRTGGSEIPFAIRVEVTMIDGTRVSRLFAVR